MKIGRVGVMRHSLTRFKFVLSRMHIRANNNQQTNIDQMDSTFLTKLPAEIRQRIYEEHYTDGAEIIIYFMHNSQRGKCVARMRPPITKGSESSSFAEPVYDFVKLDRKLLHLPLTCRQMCVGPHGFRESSYADKVHRHSESISALYSQTNFRFLSPDALAAFSIKVPSQLFDHITNLRLEIPGYTLLEDYFDDRQWQRLWQIVAGLSRLREIVVDMWYSDTSLPVKDWTSVLTPLMLVARPIDFDVRVHWEPGVLPAFEKSAPFRLQWQADEGDWHCHEW